MIAVLPDENHGIAEFSAGERRAKVMCKVAKNADCEIYLHWRIGRLACLFQLRDIPACRVTFGIRA